MVDLGSINIFWSKYCQNSATAGPTPGATLFGDSKEMQNELCDLVLRGVKRATASLARYYGPDGDPLPEPGDLAIVLDGSGIPRGVIEITRVSFGAFNTVDAQFAADEGEGDGSLDYWTSEHRAFFSRQLAQEGASFFETDQIVLERFRLIWS